MAVPDQKPKESRRETETSRVRRRRFQELLLEGHAVMGGHSQDGDFVTESAGQTCRGFAVRSHHPPTCHPPTRRCIHPKKGVS